MFARETTMDNDGVAQAGAPVSGGREGAFPMVSAPLGERGLSPRVSVFDNVKGLPECIKGGKVFEVTAAASRAVVVAAWRARARVKSAEGRAHARSQRHPPS